MIRFGFSVVVMIMLLIPGLVSAQQFNAAEQKRKTKAIERLVVQEISKHRVPGLSIAVVVDDQLYWKKGFGFADLENSIPVKPNTVFRLASISKTITAVAVMQLVERGKLDLDAPIQKHCAAFPVKNHPVSSRQLLCHQSGVRHYLNDDEQIVTKHYPTIVEALDIFKDDALLHEPGSHFTYTTYGYNVLGCAIEGAASMRYQDYLRENIFKPALMTSTRADDVFELIPHRARGYARSEGKVKNMHLVDFSYKIPGGGLCSTVEDLAKYAIALNSGQLLKRESLEKMWTVQKTKDGKDTPYGLGWYLYEHNGHKEVAHTGGQHGVSTVIYLIPELHFAVAILANMEGREVSDSLLQLSREIGDLVLVSDQKVVVK